MNCSEFIWSQKYNRVIMALLKECYGDCEVNNKSGSRLDRKENTDFTVQSVKHDIFKRISCRVRRYKVYTDYFNDITIRAKVPSGGETEQQKYKRGDGDAFIYAFENENENGIQYARVVDLQVIRMLDDEYYRVKGKHIGNFRDNFDGTGFVAIDLSTIPHFVNGKPLILFEKTCGKKLENSGISFEDWILSLEKGISVKKIKQYKEDLISQPLLFKFGV